MKNKFKDLLKSNGLSITETRLKLLNALSNFNEFVSIAHLSVLSKVEIRSTYNVLNSLFKAGLIEVETGKASKFKLKQEYK